MNLRIDEYAHLDSMVHRWQPRARFLTLLALIVAFSLVRDLRLVPAMLVITAGLYVLSRLPLRFLLTRLRYPGMFLLALVVILPLFSGQTTLWQAGPLTVRAEGLEYMLLVVSRFGAILTVSLVLFGTAPFMTNIRVMRGLGLPSLLTDMLLLTVRYLFEIVDSFERMRIAARLRGFTLSRPGRHNMVQLSRLVASLLIRSHEQGERVYKAMRLRGYGMADRPVIDEQAKTNLDDNPVGGVEPALHVAGLSFSYPGGSPALSNVNLIVRRGERVGLIGPNGAGKTSLFLSACGVLAPAAGNIRLCGAEVRAGRYHPEVGLVFQNSDDQLFSPTVREDVAFGPINSGLDANAIAERVREALELTGSQHLAERAPHHLSGGEKRMVAIATVLAMNPGVVLYDEPDANLDVRSRRRLVEFLRRAPHTLILASHNLTLILEVCDRVVVMDAGQIVADGPAQRILADRALMEAHGLETPYPFVKDTPAAD